MPKRLHLHKPSASRAINKLIIVVAVLQPLGTIPQAWAIYSRRDATSISITSWLIYLVFDAVWLWYGIITKQNAVIISAGLFGFLEGLVIIGAILYGGGW